MGTHDSETRSVTGDPEKLSKANREAGHDNLVKSMSVRDAALTNASGTVSDHRRLVAFVYLLLRDTMTFGRMEETLRVLETFDSCGRTTLYQVIGRDALETCAMRLSVRPNIRLRNWLDVVLYKTESPTEVFALVDGLPDDDDTETVFTNGWLASYAKYVADGLLAEGDDGCA